MGRCAPATLIILFGSLFVFSLVLLIGRTVYLDSFTQSGIKVPADLKRTQCTLMRNRVEICQHENNRRSWTIVWTLDATHSPSVTDTAIISPFTKRTTLEEAQNDAKRFQVNTTHTCLCPRGSSVQNHSYSAVCDFSQACMLDVEEVGFLQQEAGRYAYAGRILVAVGVFLLLISVAGFITIGFLRWWNNRPEGPPDAYQNMNLQPKKKSFTIGDEDDE